MARKESEFTFIDLFAGIGGTRIAFERAGGKCVFTSEWDKFAQKTYEVNFGEKPLGDIARIATRKIPPHDILLAGFPCQPFSISGVSKKKSLNRPHGFEDLTQGTCFFEIKRILRARKPKAFLLENVKHLLHHDKGKTIRVIMKTLENELRYSVFMTVLDSKGYVPQHRERIFMVGFKQWVPFKFPNMPNKKTRLRDLLEFENLNQNELIEYYEKYTLSDHLWKYLQDYAEKHRARGNGFGYGLADLDGTTRTLSARYYKDGSEILVPQKGKNPRRLTPRECARLMGFPDSFKIPVSDTQAYKQFGNSIIVPLVYDIAKEIVNLLKKEII